MHQLNLPDIDEQFGNLIALRKKKEQSFPGVAQLFIASVIQCQPLAEVELLDVTGGSMSVRELSAEKTPISHIRTYEADGCLIREETVIYGDEACVRLNFSLKDPQQKALDLKLRVSGGFLMSPQGVPYHWQEEKLIQGVFHQDQLELHWRDKISMRLRFSQNFTAQSLGKISEDEVEKHLYFSTFNAKKRYTYWVGKDSRQISEGNALASAQKAQGRNLAYAGELPLSLKQGESVDYIIRISVVNGETAFPEGPASVEGFTELKAARTAAWNDFMSKVPELESPHTELVDTFYKSWFVLFSNQMQMDDPRLAYPFTSVNKFHYYNQFFWDSGFHAIPWIWFNDQTPAESELKNFVLNQWRNGMIPYELFLYDVNGREWMETDALTTAATQPPVLAISLMEIYKRFGNREFLEFFYEPLLRYEQWLWKYRDLEKRGLSYFYHIWETGCDNSPKYDGVTRHRLFDPALEGVDSNVFIYLLRNTLVKMAQILGKTPPHYLLERIELTKESMNTYMLDESDGFYYDVWAGDTTQIRVKAFSGILPLITDIPDAVTREKLVNSYLLSEEEFNSPCPVPSVSMSEPTFNSSDFWRGANWPQITWTFIYGLKDRHPEAAAMILDKYLATSTKQHLCNEYCDSVTGLDVGLPYQGWGTLYVDLIIRHLGGIEPLEDGFRFNPLQTRYHKLAVKNIVIHGMELAVEKTGDNWVLVIDGAFCLSMEEAIRFQVRKMGETVEVICQEAADRKKIALEVLDPSKKDLIRIESP